MMSTLDEQMCERTIPLKVGAERERSPFARILRRLARDPGGVLGLTVLTALIVIAILAPLIAPHDPYELGADLPFAQPSLLHLFGTDNLGRDELSRVIFGARISLAVSVFAGLIALVLAMPLGLSSGFAGGWIDSVVTRVFDTIFAFPGILLGVGLMAVLGANLTNVVIAVAIINVPTLGRLVRGAVIAQRNEDYVEAARSIGATPIWLVTRHVVPNILPPVLVQMTLVMTETVLLEAAFSFLGLGNRPPTPSWGTMLSEGRNFLGSAWWLGFFPGVAITVMVLGLNALGDALRIALNPRGA